MNLADMNYIEILKNNSIVDKECIKRLEGKLIKKDNEIIRLNKQIAQLEKMYDEKIARLERIEKENSKLRKDIYEMTIEDAKSSIEKITQIRTLEKKVEHLDTINKELLGELEGYHNDNNRV